MTVRAGPTPVPPPSRQGISMEQNVTVIRDCPWIIAWDEAAGSHRFVSGDVAFAGDRLV